MLIVYVGLEKESRIVCLCHATYNWFSDNVLSQYHSCSRRQTPLLATKSFNLFIEPTQHWLDYLTALDITVSIRINKYDVDYKHTYYFDIKMALFPDHFNHDQIMIRVLLM